MSSDLTRRAFLKLIVACGVPLCMPIDVGERTVIISEVWLDEETFAGAFQVTQIAEGDLLATIDLKQAFGAVRCMDDHGAIWLLETEEDPSGCGGLQIKALTSGSRRIEV